MLWPGFVFWKMAAQDQLGPQCQFREFGFGLPKLGHFFFLKPTCELAEVSWFARRGLESMNKSAFLRCLLPTRYLNSDDVRNKAHNSAKNQHENL
jgi:hypothetical protein